MYDTDEDNKRGFTVNDRRASARRDEPSSQPLPKPSGRELISDTESQDVAHMKYRRFRIVAAVIVGALNIFSYFYGSDGVAQMAFSDEDSWGMLIYGDHYVLRLVVGLLSVSLGSFIAGIIARRRGGVVGILAALPTYIFYAVLSYVLYTSHSDPISGAEYGVVIIGNKIMLVLMLLAILPLSYYFGHLGADIVSHVGPLFDKQKHCWLGVKWYFYIPLLIAFNIWYDIFMWELGSFFRCASMITYAWESGVWATIGAIFVMGLLIPIFWGGVTASIYSFFGGYTAMLNLRINGSGLKKLGKALLCIVVIPLAISLVIYGTLYGVGKGWGLFLLLLFGGFVGAVIYGLMMYPIHCVSIVEGEINEMLNNAYIPSSQS